MYNGLINVYKEPGYTSFDVVAVLRGILKQKKIGHTGTLDPDAEGVLLVCLGNATRLCDMLEDRSKAYRCRMLLGTCTDTEDTSGKVLSQADWDSVTEEAIRRTAESFVGGYDQVPPMYSALKVNGRKLYEYARAGIEVERKPRPIEISSIEIEKIELPYVTFTVSCGKGTYVRSLCRDIGEKLGCGACMEHLTRVRVSHFMVEDSLKLSDFEKIMANGEMDRFVLPVESVFADSPAITVREHAKKWIDNGNKLNVEDVEITPEGKTPSDGCLYRTYNAEGKFVAVYRYSGEKMQFVPEKMFPGMD